MNYKCTACGDEKPSDSMSIKIDEDGTRWRACRSCGARLAKVSKEEDS